MVRLTRATAVLALAAAAGSPAAHADEGASCPAPPEAVCLQRRWASAKLDNPVWLGPVPGSPEHRWVVEQRGIVHLLETATGETAVWADLRDRVGKKGWEEGLLALAAHPRFAEGERRVFVWYTAHDPRRTLLAAFDVAGEGPGRLDPSSETVLLSIEQPWANHNGGDLHFGPDGLLYIGVGDGGAGGDPRNAAQDPTKHLGKILRIDVDRSSAGRPYGIPADNPFADGQGGQPEIYALGLRNPWRMAFDDQGRLWVGDVGQNKHEEVTLVTAPGENHGWRIREGRACYDAWTCRSEGLVPPVHVYDHDVGNSITGGRIASGAGVAGLAGRYVFADFGSGRLWSVCGGASPGTGHALLAETGRRIAHIAGEPDGSIVLVDWQEGSAWAVVPCSGSAGPARP